MITIISDDEEEDSMESDGSAPDERDSGDGGGDMKLVTCSGIGCLVAKHKDFRKAEIDDKGRWFCPFCSKKRKKALRDNEVAVSAKSEAPSFNSSDVPEFGDNEKATNNVCPESGEVAEPRRNEGGNEDLAKSIIVAGSNQNEKTTSSSEEKRVPDFSEEMLYRIRKRRRVNWTDDELEMLKEGVLYYTPQVNQNVPWRKILKVGRHIFQHTRTPADLKDKWKMLCKDVLRRRNQEATLA